MLEAGSRHEDIDAEQARLRRLEEELSHFLRQEEKQTVVCPVSGTIITPRFKERLARCRTRNATVRHRGSAKLWKRRSRSPKRTPGSGHRATDHAETEITCTDDTDSDR